MEFKDKKKGKKRLIIIAIIVLAVVIFAYLNIESACWALLIIGCTLCNDQGVDFVKRKLDKISKEGSMPTGAVAVFLCLMIHLIGIDAFHWMYEENGKCELEGY